MADVMLFEMENSLNPVYKQSPPLNPILGDAYNHAAPSISHLELPQNPTAAHLNQSPPIASNPIPTKTFAGLFAKENGIAMVVPQIPTGIHKGMPSLKLSNELIQTFAKPFKFTLIGKFKHGRPSMEVARLAFAKFQLKGQFNLGHLDSRHLLIRLSNEEDYQRLFMKNVWYVSRFPMCTLAWSPSWRPEQESSIVPVWIGLPGLPIHLINKLFLFALANLIGTPLSLDKATTDLSRPSIAKVLIKVDVLKKLPREVFVECGNEWPSFQQKVEYDNIPKYCKHCFMFGHDVSHCKKANPNLFVQKNSANAEPNVGKAFEEAKTDEKPEDANVEQENIQPNYVAKKGLEQQENNAEKGAGTAAKTAPNVTVQEEVSPPKIDGNLVEDMGLNKLPKNDENLVVEQPVMGLVQQPKIIDMGLEMHGNVADEQTSKIDANVVVDQLPMDDKVGGKENIQPNNNAAGNAINVAATDGFKAAKGIFPRTAKRGQPIPAVASISTQFGAILEQAADDLVVTNIENSAPLGTIGDINAPTNDMEAIMRNIARYRESHPPQPFVEVEPKSPERFSASRAPYSFVTNMAGYTPFTPSHKKNTNADGFTMVSSRKWRGRSASPPDNFV